MYDVKKASRLNLSLGACHTLFNVNQAILLELVESNVKFSIRCKIALQGLPLKMQNDGSTMNISIFFIHFSQNNHLTAMNKLLVITLVISLLAGTFIHSGEALIRAGRNMAPYPLDERDTDNMYHLYNREESPRYFKRGK